MWQSCPGRVTHFGRGARPSGSDQSTLASVCPHAVSVQERIWPDSAAMMRCVGDHCANGAPLLVSSVVLVGRILDIALPASPTMKVCQPGIVSHRYRRGTVGRLRWEGCLPAIPAVDLQQVARDINWVSLGGLAICQAEDDCRMLSRKLDWVKYLGISSTQADASSDQLPAKRRDEFTPLWIVTLGVVDISSLVAAPLATVDVPSILPDNSATASPPPT